MIAHYADLTDPGLDDDPISVQVEVLVRCLQRQLEPRLYALAFDAVAAAYMAPRDARRAARLSETS